MNLHPSFDEARIEQFCRDTKAPRRVFDTIADNAASAGILTGGRPVEPDAVDLRGAGEVVPSDSFKRPVAAVAGDHSMPTAALWAASPSASSEHS